MVSRHATSDPPEKQVAKLFRKRIRGGIVLENALKIISSENEKFWIECLKLGFADLRSGRNNKYRPPTIAVTTRDFRIKIEQGLTPMEAVKAILRKEAKKDTKKAESAINAAFSNPGLSQIPATNILISGAFAT